MFYGFLLQLKINIKKIEKGLKTIDLSTFKSQKTAIHLLKKVITFMCMTVYTEGVKINVSGS